MYINNLQCFFRLHLPKGLPIIHIVPKWFVANPSHGFEKVYAKYRPYFVRIVMSYVRNRTAAITAAV